jgi:hypothetical protein
VRSFSQRHEARLLAALLLAMLMLLALGGCGGGGDEGGTWSTIVVGDTTLRYQATGVPATAITNPIILASGVREDPAVLASVAEVTGRTQQQAVELLSSYDTTGSHLVQVLQLTSAAYVTRYFGDPQYKLGRWYTPSERDHLYLPDEAIQLFALPLSNNAYSVTLYRLKSGVKLVAGYCADMSWNTEVFPPQATGGGQQFYIPDATHWVVDHAELNDQAIELVSELRYPVAQ